MDRERKGKAFLLCILLVGLVSLSNVAPVVSRSVEAGSTSGLKDATWIHSHKKPACTTPSGGGSTPTVPSHGGGGYYNPPSGDGGHSVPTPAPSHGSTPATPSHGGGGYYNPPSGGGGHSSPVVPTPTTPVVVPPVLPTPTTPIISTPPSPVIPNVPPFSPGTCKWWSTHPEAILGIFGYWGTVGDLLGAACTAAYGKSPLTLHDALTNTRPDAIGSLFREGTAALLNSMTCKTFPFTAPDVKRGFAAAVASDGAAAAQAAVFKQANEGRFKTRS